MEIAKERNNKLRCKTGRDALDITWAAVEAIWSSRLCQTRDHECINEFF